MHLGDSIFIFLLALVLFGPKRMPEIAKQIGKLLAEFRRASNEFKMQIDEELRNLDRQEEQKKREARLQLAENSQTQSSQTETETPAGELASGASSETAETAAETPSSDTLTIMPPSSGTTVSASSPYMAAAETEPFPEPSTAMPAEPSDAPAAGHLESSETPQADAAPAPAALNGASSHTSEQEHESTSLHHG
ncbi:Sec-independent protein translocase subunit TatA/TatB [Paracidobacterium acidisoli]|uniref:Sec-independent translocation protein MttA n=1 Tax=Paracidobacterium acidisoli TaxID=2303751 RepID=A0A372IKJ1_9BACT|nr:twin-arginine translocase TatA/TatE family subunit [Paracidobacterium acidisoli]MBT9332846.1 twin-arginine translocase TatA/TatE family subunit [Paracidobacterium acidisoli]